jgi:REP-associated tyrosine transposase
LLRKSRPRGGESVPYWQHYCHLVWGTKRREPLIDNEVGAIIVRSVQSTCLDCRAILHAMGIMPEHIHLAVSIPPRLAIAEFVRSVKGASSYELNKTNRIDRLARFGWQAEYGLISFGERSLASVVAYVNNQAAHHAANNLWPSFEILESRPSSPDSG